MPDGAMCLEAGQGVECQVGGQEETESGDRRESSCQRVTVLILHLFEKSFGEAYREERRDQDSEIREE